MRDAVDTLVRIAGMALCLLVLLQLVGGLALGLWPFVACVLGLVASISWCVR